MKPKHLLLLGLLWFGGKFALAGLDAVPITAPVDMSDVFGPANGSDAKTVANYLDGLADVIEADADRDPQPILQTDADCERVRVDSIWFLGRKLNRGYPGFGQVAGEYMQKKVGDEIGELTPTQRARWVQAYRDLADSCRAAAGGW